MLYRQKRDLIRMQRVKHNVKEKGRHFVQFWNFYQ